MKCKYEKLNGHCRRKALDNSNRGYCLLHEGWNHKNEEETKEEFYREIEEGETDFEGCILPEVNLSGKKIDGFGISFYKATIKGDIYFNDARIEGFVGFYGATIEGNAWFSNTTIKGQLIFTWAIIKGLVLIVKTTVEEHASFDGATIKSIAVYPSTKFTALTFKHAKFEDIRAEENACRMAKITQERLGNRASADYHLYREKVAKRKQKRCIWRYLELPIQYIFRYGTHWWGILFTWFLVAFGSAFAYWFGNGIAMANEIIGISSSSSFFDFLYSFLNCLYFSSVITTFGYGDFHPVGSFKLLATFEAIFGTFMWAVFIAIFTRKYAR